MRRGRWCLRPTDGLPRGRRVRPTGRRRGDHLRRRSTPRRLRRGFPRSSPGTHRRHSPSLPRRVPAQGLRLSCSLCCTVASRGFEIHRLRSAVTLAGNVLRGVTSWAAARLSAGTPRQPGSPPGPSRSRRRLHRTRLHRARCLRSPPNETADRGGTGRGIRPRPGYRSASWPSARSRGAAQAEVVAYPPVDGLVAEPRRAAGDVHPQGAEAALDDACGRIVSFPASCSNSAPPVPTATYSNP